MSAYKYAFNQRVWVPGLERIQGIVIEQRGHAFKGNSYLVTWHELTAVGIEIKEQVFTEADLDANVAQHMVVEFKVNHDDVNQWIRQEADRLMAESQTWPVDPPAKPKATTKTKRAAARKRKPVKRSKRRARR